MTNGSGIKVKENSTYIQYNLDFSNLEEIITNLNLKKDNSQTNYSNFDENINLSKFINELKKEYLISGINNIIQLDQKNYSQFYKDTKIKLTNISNKLRKDLLKNAKDINQDLVKDIKKKDNIMDKLLIYGGGLGVLTTGISGIISYYLAAEYSTKIGNELNEFSYLLSPITGLIQTTGSILTPLLVMDITKNSYFRVGKYIEQKIYNHYNSDKTHSNIKDLDKTHEYLNGLIEFYENNNNLKRLDFFEKQKSIITKSKSTGNFLL